MASSPIRKRLSDSDSDPPVKRLRGAQAEGETTSDDLTTGHSAAAARSPQRQLGGATDQRPQLPLSLEENRRQALSISALPEEATIQDSQLISGSLSDLPSTKTSSASLPSAPYTIVTTSLADQHPGAQIDQTSSIPHPPEEPSDKSQSFGTQQVEPAWPDDMSDSGHTLLSPPEPTLVEKLRHLRAASAIARQSDADSRRSTKSPSAIPERPSFAQSDDGVHKPSSLRAQALAQDSRDEMTSSALSDVAFVPRGMSQKGADSISSTIAPRLGVNEYIVPLPMNARVRDQYRQAVVIFSDEIEAFTRAEEPVDASLLRSIERMIDKVKNITVHPDLENEGALTQQEVEENQEAKWAENSSAKFAFLRHLFDAMRERDEDLAILARPGPTLDILETFMKGNDIDYTRPDQHSPPTAIDVSSLHVTLLATGEEGAGAVVSQAVAVIAFDDTFDAEDVQVGSLRADTLKVGQLSPVISLVVVKSAEHIERCMPSTLSPMQQLQAMVSCIAQTRHEVGQLPPGAPSPAVAAQDVAAFLGAMEGEATPWILPSLEEISSLDVFTETQESAQSYPTQPSSAPSEIKEEPTGVSGLAQVTRKRSLSIEDADLVLDTSKRVRLTTVIGDKSAVINSEANDVSKSTGGDRDERVPEVRIISLEQKDLANIQQLVSEIQQEAKAQVHRQESPKATNRRLEEHVQALGDLQYRFEEQVEVVRNLRAERNGAVAALTQAERRRDAAVTEVGKLKEERTSLQEELSAARSALERSSVPEVVELEKARAEARKAMAENQQMEHRLQSMTRDFDFTRAQYQQASTVAAEAMSELSTLREENKVLQRKASGEAMKVRQMSAAAGEERNLNRIRELESKLADREEMLWRKGEEARTNNNGRGKGVSTRASSVPRSPRPYTREPYSREPPTRWTKLVAPQF